ncbi:HK97 family phage prohead protease [Amycolatopsis japonica]|uniref:HK97 family phage prohead protease n=1 Tax=Amycolatopsis japonica TaxID=208439 RepID=UPI0037ACA917
MTDIQTRSFTPDIEVRSGGDGRTVAGIVVPYGYAQRIDAELIEQFASGAFDHQFNAAHRIKLTRDHQIHGGQIIGNARVMRNDAAGLYMEFRVSNTERGNETLELLRDGVLSDLSIGFRAAQDRRLPNGVIERTKAHLFEVSVVPEGAYGEEAMVTGVRSELLTPGLDKARQILAAWPVLPA